MSARFSPIGTATLATPTRDGLLSAADKAKLNTLTTANIATLQGIAATRSEVQAYQATNVAVANGTPIPWVFSNEQVDALGEFNPATGVYTAHHACKIIVSGHFQLVNPPDQQNALVLLYDGTGASLLLRLGSATKSGPATTPFADISVPFAAVARMAAGGTFLVKYQIGNVAATAQTMRGGVDASYLRIVEVV